MKRIYKQPLCEFLYLESEGAIAASGKATVYIPFVEAIKAVMEPGYYFDITATVDGSTLKCKKTFTSSKTIERDKVYTINATFE
ncbi:MAG: hypothetical protein II159_05520 [Bacteroidales bacterium]|nr:hypothetical protein [Bacteroidales bacterium]MBQ2483546.1 hypothetical protein [Bacteroidales bacterium]MBQ4196482.1 hypothetical protein [Bacteroidales bacterium]